MENENKQHQETVAEETSIQSKNETMTDNNKEVGNKSTSSEYETNESSSDGEEPKEHLNNHEEDELFASDDSVVLEREEGDGQESVSAKKVDDDEDKKNPQYIPKRGTFYEHDDRTLEDSEDKQETPEKTEKQNKKNVWMEKKERWSHDRYNDNEQAPKSRSELVSIYGYDIRNEDGPPKARRRRRYGRGPNKYTRTWEDEDAYRPTKPIKNVKPKTNRKKEDDYPIENFESNDNNKEEYSVKDKTNLEEVKNQQTSPSTAENKAPPSAKYRQEPPKRTTNSNIDHSSYRPQHQRIGTGRVIKSKPEVNREIKDSDYKGFTKTRQFRNSKSEQKVLPKNYKMDNALKRNSNEDCSEDLQKDLSQMNIQEESSKSNKQNNQRQNSVPPRLQAEQKGSKRYSSLRQRSLPETAVPTFNQAANYYATEYNPATPPAQQAILQQPTAIHGSTPPVPQIAPPPLPTMPQQVSVTANPILQAPPQFATPFPQAPPPFLPPTVPTASFIPQQAPPIINYVQGQAQFPQAAPPYQGFQHQQFNAVNQPAELYQCQGGTTYYSTQNQHLGQRSVPQKRPKAAIPIVPPPPQEPRGRGRSSNQRDPSTQGEEICETIIIDNSNNYEDSIVYVQQ